ncbi:M23 family metallopeptidase [Coraliomargarita sp. SDUM461004]|uniref:M23 family metallopeptidase n=1 Tax=Thalassobacterium sedimentorum TaxID=3041258 RepID=A0ABU1AEN5_9BACT|nr:M23 family metallopeptidase [Coraliomargarita sp. SDUM461004]MDQ8193239.1 M23 family metallopeptidase [Coraliomargarita sp. SDUM461004]
MKIQQFFLLLALLVPLFANANLIWPTPNPAFQNGESIESFIQPTVSGVAESGLFGCVRNSGSRFHEGLDLFPVERDRRGEALDPVYAVLPGKVVHTSRVAGHSSYGRYVVVEHDREVPSYHTLYAHLASVSDGIVPGARVEAGTVLGIMGRSATYTIPRSRAHVHFEIGFRLTRDFQAWYDRQKFGSKNQHGSWNGMNLVSIDPLAFYRSIRHGEVKNLYEHLHRLPAFARIRVYSDKVPGFVEDYPSLVTKPFVGRAVVAWDIAFTQYGVPKEWTPRFAEDQLKGQAGDVKVIAYNPTLLEAQSCRRVLDLAGPTPTIASGTIITIKKLFGFK